MKNKCKTCGKPCYEYYCSPEHYKADHFRYSGETIEEALKRQGKKQLK